MTAAKSVKIVRREDGRLIEAMLHAGLKPEDLLLIEREWTSHRLRIFYDLVNREIPRNQWPQSLHWNWERKAFQLRLLAAQGVGLNCEGAWQGVMLTQTVSHIARLNPDRGKPLVYIDYLETAPWNWRIEALGQEGRWKGVGSIFVREAVEQSEEEGFHGRVGLHALAQAERFYTDVCGMAPLGPDPMAQDLIYFELCAHKAKEFLNAGGDR